MVHFNNLIRHWKRGGRHPAHRDGPGPIVAPPGSTVTSSTSSISLIIPVAPTIVGNPFATTTTPSLSPSLVQSCV